MTYLKPLRSLVLLLALAVPLASAHASAQDSDEATTEASADASTEATTSLDAGEGTPAQPGEGPAVTDEVSPEDEESGVMPISSPAVEPSTQPAASEPAAASGEAEATSERESEGEEAAEERQASVEPLAWRNSFFNYGVGMTVNSFCQDCQLSYNPTVYQFLSLTPRWYLDASTFFFFSLGGAYEFTDDDGSAYNHEFQLSDMVVELRRTIAWEGFIFIPAARLTFPTSKASQGAQRFLNTGIGLTVVRPIPEAAGMTIAGLFRYQRWFADGNVVTARGQCLPSMPGNLDGSAGIALSNSAPAVCDGRSATEADRLLAGITLSITPVEGFTITLSGAWAWVHAFDVADASWDDLGVITSGSGELVPRAGGDTRWRNYAAYSLSVAYDVVDWLNLSLSLDNSGGLAPLYNQDGSVRSPFNPDTQISLSATFTLDGIYKEIAGASEDDGLTPEQRQRRRQGLASSDAPASHVGVVTF